MTTLMVPPLDREPWPSLGGAVCDLIEERAVFGPGSLKGQPAKLDAEKRAAIWRMYEIYPRGHEFAGRRRFKRVRLSWRKGTAKTELGGWIAFAELHPESEVRFDGWDANGNPVGRPVRDPYIPLLAYTEDQVSELAFGVLKVVCEEGPDADLFDVSLERILRLDERGRADGKAVPLAGSPSARDGARTTFQYYDETHRLLTPRHHEAVTTMEANLPKRPLDDPWSLGTTTAGRLGDDSMAERDRDEAEMIANGRIKDPQLFYFHRQASDASVAEDALKSVAGRIKAISEATGPAGEYGPGQFRDIALQWDKPRADIAYLERTWLNRWHQGATTAFDKDGWHKGADLGHEVPRRAAIAVGFDGARWRDTAAMVGTELATGFQWPIGIWDPADYGLDADGSPIGIPLGDVDAVFDEVCRRFNVVRVYGDPAQGWDANLSSWSGKLGPKRVHFFYTDSRNLMRTAQMCRTYAAAIAAGEVGNDGDPTMADHIGHAQKRDVKMLDEDGVPLWVMSKERPDSPFKIDASMAGGLSWQAALDAIKSGDMHRGGLTRVRGRVGAR